ncbi:MAG: hypothetical protein M1833_005092 [Piccolia ochrophora]|nr:MAG: hypothetical protein M1833_005092 [Piccolia ochrophora]
MEAPSNTIARKDRVFSRGQIEILIANQHTIIIVDQKVLKVDAWLKYHPGGQKAIQHMVGRDATDEVNALHSADARRRMSSYQIGRIEGRWKNFLPPIQGGVFQDPVLGGLGENETENSSEAENTTASTETSRSASPLFDPADCDVPMVRNRGPTLHHSSSDTSLSSLDLVEEEAEPKLSYLDARTQEGIDLDLATYPPLDPATQDEIVHKYRVLEQRIRAEGLFQCRYTSYLFEIARYLMLFGACLYFLHAGWYTTSGLFLGLFWHQLVFTAHDAGHMGITHSFAIDTTIGIIVADFLGGLSLGWWKRSHNVHHIVTNSPEHDPDIAQMPFFAISHRFFESIRSTYYDRVLTYDPFARLAIRYQAYLYYPILALGRFNLYILSWCFLLGGQSPRHGPAKWTLPLEIAGQCFFWSWYGYAIIYRSIPTFLGRVAFVLASHLITGPLHVQITLSHYAMSTADLGPAESFPQKMLRTTMDVACPPFLDFIHGGLQFQAVHHLFPRVPRHNLRKVQALVMTFCEETEIPYALLGFVDGNKKVIGRLGEVGRQAAILAACQREVAKKGVLH